MRPATEFNAACRKKADSIGVSRERFRHRAKAEGMDAATTYYTAFVEKRKKRQLELAKMEKKDCSECGASKPIAQLKARGKCNSCYDAERQGSANPAFEPRNLPCMPWHLVPILMNGRDCISRATV